MVFAVLLALGWSVLREKDKRERAVLRRELGVKHGLKARVADPRDVSIRSAAPAQLLELLATSDWHAEAAAAELARRRDAAGHDRLLTMLKLDNSVQRDLAAQYLGAFGVAEDFQLLEAAFRDESSGIRPAAAMGLARTHDERAFPMLRGLLGAGEPGETTDVALRALAIHSPKGMRLALD
ncbi:MAG: HEAT repeat domain-containing protein, partial [Acidobacteriota bacterium]|nr:HEAT repeat domain-containing protein [Acidobacteriota bacterium]